MRNRQNSQNGSVFSHDIEVRFRDLDSLGHINNAVYLSYVEQCRLHWLLHASLCSRDRLHAVPFILARAAVDFLKPGFVGDTIKVQAWVSHIGSKSFHMQYELSNGQKELLARSEAVLVWFDYQAQCSIKIPDDARKHIEPYLRVTSS